jgi:hypothetical protein
VLDIPIPMSDGLALSSDITDGYLSYSPTGALTTADLMGGTSPVNHRPDVVRPEAMHQLDMHGHELAMRDTTTDNQINVVFDVRDADVGDTLTVAIDYRHVEDPDGTHYDLPWSEKLVTIESTGLLQTINTTIPATGVFSNGGYEWKVITYDSAGAYPMTLGMPLWSYYGASVNSAHFFINSSAPSNLPPADFEKLAPANGSTATGDVSLSWKPALDPDGDPVTYEVRVYRRGVSTPEIVHSNLTATNIDILSTSLAPGTVYEWNVGAFDGRGGETWANSNTRWTFNFQPTDISLWPRVIAADPHEGATNVATSVALGLEFSEGIRDFNCSITNAVTGTPVSGISSHLNSEGTKVTINQSGLNPNTDYTLTTTGGNSTATGRLLATFVLHFRTGSGGSTGDVNVPRNLRLTKSANDAILAWESPSAGEPTGGYHVYRGTSPAAITTPIGGDISAGTHTLTDTGAVTSPDSYYYVVKSFAGVTESTPSNMAVLLKQTFTYNEPSTLLANKHWVSIPYATAYTNANDILISVNGAASPGVPNAFPITSIVRRNPTTQQYESATYNSILSSWLYDPGPDAFAIVTGEGFEVTVDRTATVAFAGANDPTFNFSLAFHNVASGLSNKHWISIPYLSSYADGQALINSINGGNPTPGTAVSIVRWNPTTQLFESVTYNDLLSSWLNDPGPGALPVITGEAFEVTINADTTWRPTVIIP